MYDETSDDEVKPRRKRARRLPEITAPRLRCPECGCFRLRKYRSISDQGDGSSLSWVQCTNGHRFRLILE